MPTRRGGGGGESKQGLVVALVFFVIFTIGLGVATYFGFAGQDELAKKEADAKKELAGMKDNREFYRAQALTYRTYMGYPPADAGEVPDLKAKLEEGKLGDAKDKEDVKGVLAGLGGQGGLGWDPAGKKPRKTYQEALADAKKQAETLDQQNKDLQDKLAAAEKRASNADAAAKKARDDYEANVANLAKKQEADLAGYLKEIADLRAQKDKMGAEREQFVKDAETKVKSAGEDVAKAAAQTKTFRERAEKSEAKLDLKQKEGADAPLNARTDWKVVSIATGQNVYINLGSADNVKPQLTFSVHGVGPAGHIVPAAKANLEVVRVLEPHLSQARLFALRDPNRDPVVKGDVLYNPTWDPQLKRHVALAGVMDLTGSGHDSFDELKRYLERNNVEIDAYLDPKDLTIKGKGITPQTDYLILGGGQEIAQENRASREKDRVERRDKAMQQLREQAQQSGVKVVALSHYLEMVGYRLPRNASELGSAARPSSGGAPPASASPLPPPAAAEPKEPAGDDKGKDKDKPPGGG
jgi:hypothetical protein